MEWRSEWAKVRERVLERDAYACRECPTTAEDVGVENLHAHHVRPRADGGPDERANCVTLCQTCHLGKHKGGTVYYDSEFVQAVHGYGPLKTGEVSEWLGCDRSTARRRLVSLESDGHVARERGDGPTTWRPPRSLGERILDVLWPRE